MSEFERFQGKAGIVGFCRSLYVGSVLILNIGLARAMGPEAFGSFQQVFIFNALFLILTLGIPETLYYFLPRFAEEDRPRFLGQTLQILLLSGIACIGLFWLIAPYLASVQHNPAIVGELRIFGIYGAFVIASSFSDPVFIWFKRIRNLFLLNVFHAVFLLGLTAWYYFTKGSASVIFAAMAVFGACKFVLALWLLYGMRQETGEIHFFQGKSTILLQLSFALPIVMSSTIDIISRWLDKYVVSFFFGAEALGVFFVGAIEVPFIGVFVSSVYSVISPVLNTLHYKGDFRGFAKVVTKAFKFTTKIIWPVFIYLFIFADHIIPLVFRESYEGAVAPFRIYLTMLPLRVASYGVIVVAIGRPRAVLQCAFLSLTANVILNIVLALQIGFIGPALATVISTWIHVGMLLTIIVTEIRIDLADIVPFRHLFTVAATAGLSGLAAYSLTLGLTEDVETIAISLIIFVALYFFLGSKAGLIRYSDFLELAGGTSGGKKPES